MLGYVFLTDKCDIHRTFVLVFHIIFVFGHFNSSISYELNILVELLRFLFSLTSWLFACEHFEHMLLLNQRYRHQLTRHVLSVCIVCRQKFNDVTILFASQFFFLLLLLIWFLFFFIWLIQSLHFDVTSSSCCFADLLLICWLDVVYKKYGVTCCAGITRSVSGTALNIITLRSLEVLKSNIDATLPQR